MRILSFCILLMLSHVLIAQTIDNPSFKAHTGSIHNISRIERTPESTQVYIHTIFRPHWWITVDRNSYLEDAETGKKFSFKGAEGIELNKQVYMPDTGEMDYVLFYEPLPKETRTIHLLDSSGVENNTYDISLVPQKYKKASLMESIKGNWFEADRPNQWVCGFYDSITIMKNRIYKNESLRKKGKRIELTMKDNQDGTTAVVLFKLQKDGNCKISVDGADEYLYTKQRNPAPIITADNGYQDFFRTDSACLQGYIDGYDPRFGFETGIIYLSNEFTRDDYPTVIAIKPDGSFQCKFQLHHPVCNSAAISNCWFPFYIEPGQTLTMYIDWEDILARSRARNRDFPLKNTAFMGPCASLSYLATDLQKVFTYDYDDLSKSRKELTPNQYKEHIHPFFIHWKQASDSLIGIYANSTKATHLIQNAASLKCGGVLFDFLMSREYYAQQDSTNQALKVPEDDSYYDFLKEMPLDDETMLVNADADIFINRFEYMNPLRYAYRAATYTNSGFKWENDLDKYRMSHNIRIAQRKDSIINKYCGNSNSLLWQIAKVRNLKYELQTIKSDKIAREYTERRKKEITYPILTAAAEELLQSAHPDEGEKTYRLPEGTATEIFRNITRNHPGKVLFVDFWATTCGPCRAGIEATAELRKKYKDHPKFQFIYVSSEKESPETAYKNYVEKNLKGEACYYVTETEFNYLRQLFKFNGIPHYELVEEDGTISKENLGSHNIEQYLEKRFGTPDSENAPN